MVALGQVTPSLVTVALAKLKSQGRSDRTVFHYVAAVKSFTRWLKTNRRTRFDLLEDLKRPTNVSERNGHALTPAQTAMLIAATRTARASVRHVRHRSKLVLHVGRLYGIPPRNSRLFSRSRLT